MVSLIYVKNRHYFSESGHTRRPNAKSVRRYLKEFLSDTRVIEIPKLIWQVILTGFVLTTRPKRVAHAYASIWMDDGSPLLVILKKSSQRFAGFIKPARHKTLFILQPLMAILRLNR